MRVLLTNITLASRTGTETYVRDLARGLVQRGHQPIVYSPDLGDIARDIETATVPVVNDLRHIGTPIDAIHGHHHAETLTALLHFPGVPAVGFCHDWGSFWDTPVRHPRVRRFVAVDETCRDRLVARHGIPEAKVRVVLNAVDLDQFPPRDPLPSRPARALVFSNMAGESNYLGMVRSACATAGIALDVIGQGVGATCARPGDVLGKYDVVFAKARCAQEAMAVGAAVILCDVGGVGGLVTTDNFDLLRRWNFGRRALCQPLRAEILVRDLMLYDAADAGAVSSRIRHEASLGLAIDELLALYSEVIDEQRHAGPVDAEAEGRAAADSIRWLTPYFREIHTQRGRLMAAVRERDEMQAKIDGWRLTYKELETTYGTPNAAHAALTEHVVALQENNPGLQRECDLLYAVNAKAVAELTRLEQEMVALRLETCSLREQLANVHQSLTVRMSQRLRGIPFVKAVVKLAR